MIIDAHCHVFDRAGWSEHLADRYLEAGLAETPTWWDRSRTWTREDQLAPPDRLIAAMDAAGVDQAVVFGFTSRVYGSATTRAFVRDAAQAYPDRFIPFFAVDPLGGRDARREFEAALDDDGFKGGKLLAAYSHLPLDDARLYPFYALAEDRGIPLVVHTGSTRLPDVKLAWQDPALLDDVGAAFPDLRLWHAHAGMQRWATTFTLLARYPRMVADLSFWGKYPPIMAAEAMAYAKQLGIVSRLFWGTDYPFWSPTEDLARWRGIPAVQRQLGLEPVLDDGDLAGILGGNVSRALGLSEA